MAAPTANGLYATFRLQRGATSVGEFTCRLDFGKVPRTVANFLGLAEGASAWIDFQAGHATRRPFYDGLTFHRVVSGFVIQAGSPKGDGSDGPGYTFRDEFDPTLRHNKAGILSMANSGLNSNGSQFFVTLAATAWLDDVHSVFGEVVEGLNVVTSVAQGDVIDRVVIIRNGAGAQAFSAAAHGVPTVLDAGLTLQPTPSGFQLNYAQPANTEFFFFRSDTLSTWVRLAGKEIEGVTPVSAPRDVSTITAGKGMQFFNAARVQYPDAILAPPAVVGKRLTLTDAGNFIIEFSLPNAQNGTYTYTSAGATLGPFPVSTFSWNQEAYRGQFIGIISGLTYNGWPVNQANISFVFTSAVTGNYAGNLLNTLGQPIPARGTLVVSSLNP